MTAVEFAPVEKLQVNIKAPTPDTTLPESEWLIFPPFPEPPAGVKIQLFSDFEAPGVYVVDTALVPKKSESVTGTSSDDENEDEESELVEHDSHIVPLVTLGIAHDPASKEARAKARWEARSLKKRLIWRLEYEDCWKIGEEGSGWVEREQTTQHVYDLTSPPFERLILATRDFLLSRHAAFQNPLNKLMFDSLRSALNIRLEFPGQHWPAPQTHDDGSNVRHKEDEDGEDFAPAPEEICILLREPVMSIRGFLALARKEAEATWVLDRALNLASIVSAFMSFLNHYNVLPDANIYPGFVEALAIARGCHTALLQADQLEQGLNDVKGFNMASWSVWARAKEMGQIEEGLKKLQIAPLVDADGWDATATEAGPPKGMSIPEPLSKAQATSVVAKMIHPTSPSDLQLIHQIPFSRRIITHVQPPKTCLNPEDPHFQSQLYRVITAPAPWTPEEKWRQRRPRQSLDDEDEDAEDFVHEEPELGPMELTVWVTKDAIADLLSSSDNLLVGMGLRGAWSHVGNDTLDFWLFRAKDFVLPNFWQSKAVTARTAKEVQAKVKA